MFSEHKPEVKELLSFGDFCLNSGVFFVEGAKRCALYDSNTGNVYSLDSTAGNVLTGVKKNPKFWEKLSEMELVGVRTEKEQPVLPELIHKQKLDFVWFEIVEDCNERCTHCYGDFKPPQVSAQKPETSSPKLTYLDWKKQIDDTFNLGCKTCQFIGGEPFMYRGENRETVLDLAKYAKEKGFTFIEIFTNGTMITSEKVKRLKELDINMAVSLYSLDSNIHDQITQTRGSHKKTMHGLDMLKETGVNTRVETVLMSINEQTAEETQKYAEDMGFGHKRLDVLRQNGRGEDTHLLPSEESLLKYGVMTSPNFNTSRESFAKNMYANSCLAGKITITNSGDILPCVFSRDQVVGNVRETKLKDIVERRELENIWANTKDDVLVCQDCEYKYCCSDCRPQAHAMNKKRGTYLNSPYPKCSYNPYAGEWGKGFWRLDNEGKPSYGEIVRGGENIEN